MATFLTTSGVSYHLEDLIKKAQRKITLISPFLKINPKMKQLLEDADRMKLDIRIVYGKSELTPDESDWLSKTNIRTSYLDNLHAKCYMADETAIITSMNLYAYSQVNNLELGILINRSEDQQLFDDLEREVNSFLRNAKELKVSITTVQGKSSPKPKSSSPDSGHCIRCNKPIKADAQAPYCRDCFNVWRAYENPEYKEKYCHACGKETQTTMNKPLCTSCYKKSVAAL